MNVELTDSQTMDAGNLAAYFAGIITSRHNQHAICMIVGTAGSGKSWAGLNLALETSKEVAKIKGGVPEDYFDLKKNIGVISREEIKRIMSSPLPYNILMVDDVAVAWNARKYKDDFNLFLNDIIQTFRPQHNLVIMTLQANFLIDKVPRSLTHYLIEMEQAYFDYGISLAKVFKVVLKHRKGQIHHEYLVDGAKYVRHVFYAPDKAITDKYEEVRAEQLKKMNEEKEEEPKLGLESMFPLVQRWLSAGKQQKEIAELLGYSPQHVNQVIMKHRKQADNL